MNICHKCKEEILDDYFFGRQAQTLPTAQTCISALTVFFAVGDNLDKGR
jgi:hypothetical protein